MSASPLASALLPEAASEPTLEWRVNPWRRNPAVRSRVTSRFVV